MYGQQNLQDGGPFFPSNYKAIYSLSISDITKIIAEISNIISWLSAVLKSPYPDQEGNKLIFLSEWREFRSVPCLAGKKKLDKSSRLDVVEIARIPDNGSELVSLLVGLRTYQHPGTHLANYSLWIDITSFEQI